VKEEPAASDGPPPAGVGSSDSDSSGVLNDTDATGATPAAEAPAPDLGTPLGGPNAAVTGHAHAFFHGSFPKLEEDETGFLDDDEPCGGFFADEPPLAWWTEPTEPWK
jgi:homeobox-leucine zipper protein